MKRLGLTLSFLLALPLALGAAPRGTEQKPDPKTAPAAPSYVQRVEPAVVGIRVQVPRNRPSVLTLGPERWGSGVIFDPAGYALTVSYVLLDAGRIEVSLRDGRTVPAKLVGLDLEVGLGVVKLDGPGPWPAAAVGDSSGVSVGQTTATVGVDEDNALVVTSGSVTAVRAFAGYWEYMLDRAFVIAPYNPAFGGSPLVNVNGEVIGITSLRLGERPAVNLAIPLEKFLLGKDELIQKGRVVSRKPRPWLGLYTVPVEGGGGVIAGVSPVGPAGRAGFQRGDVIVRVNGEKVVSQEEFYMRLWAAEVGQELTVMVLRGSRFEAITVRPADRYQFFHTTGP
ncbi:MAG: serine protease [Candidatus Rokubacteria bacterium]|nr:serine protease [Candidatus Rokubacteria bacterium]